jgi:exodeoxyribonuclease VII large subunit
MRNDEPTDVDIFSVSEITLEIKEILELQLPAVCVEGEVSNFVRHGSGHLYFSLKDENAQLACVVWRARTTALFITPRDGMKVRAFGSIRIYEKRGTYQLDILRMMPAGVGELQLAFEALKVKLREEGLFEPQFKKPLPDYPEKIGIISSATGAAVRDIVQVLNRRMPSVVKILRPTLVQGEDAAEDIAAAISDLNEFGDVDLIILARGGGSLEDLWAFNEEIVARAIFASKIPIISAVGHEIDFTISDFVADLRAPTPSAAAELAVRNSVEVLATMQAQMRGITNAVQQCIQESRNQVERLIAGYAFRRPADMVLQRRQRIDEMLRSITVSATNSLQLAKEKSAQLSNRLRSLHPDAVLRRGYSLVWNADRRQFVRALDQADLQETLDIFLSSGTLNAQVTRKTTDRRYPEALGKTRYEKE